MEHNEAFYRVARKVYEDDGRSIIDATVGGKCNIFTKADYTDVMYNRAPKRALHSSDVTNSTMSKLKGRVIEDMDTLKFLGSPWIASEQEELGR